jgi:Domain of unknown function (DU1801)
MAENKTQATQSDPGAYVAAITDEARRQDCEALLSLMKKASKQSAVMWGPSIIGFGIHRYPLASGRQGEICAVGFSSRKGDISIYGVTGASNAVELLAKLGKHKLGKGCLYVARLADIDLKVLAKLVSQSITAKLA